jgi:UDP-N-acetylmuramyl pentapeptide phosphotransferase/UDP-N-acetylglucosamine-1-phosphate transferase
MRSMDDLFLQSGVIPFATAAVGAGFLRLIGESARGPLIAAGGIGMGFLAGFVLILGALERWPQSSGEKLFTIAALATALGLALDLSRVASRVTRLIAALSPVAALTWLGWPRIVGQDWIDITALAATALGGGFVLTRLFASGQQATASNIKLMIACIALALVSIFGASASLGQLAGALAAAVAGFLAWNWPVARFPTGAAAVLGGGLTFVALIGVVAVFTDAPKPALAMLLPIFFADLALSRMPRVQGGIKQAVRPILLAAVAAIPALAAVGLASLLSGGGY